MKSVFTKTWVQVVALLCLAFVAAAFLANDILENYDYADFQLDAAVDSELIAFRMANYDISEWEYQLQGYQTEFNLSVGGLLDRVDDTWIVDERNASLYSKPIDSETWESAWKIPGSQYYIWLVDDGSESGVADFIEGLSPLALIFIIVGASLYLLARKIAHPIRQLTHSTQALASGESGVRVGSHFDEPFHSLANNFDSMADRIEQLLTDQKILIGALPHELRAPVSRLRFGLDLTRNVENMPEMHDRIVMLDVYLSDLEQVLEQTLLLTNLQQQEQEVWGQFNLHNLATDIVEKFNAQLDITFIVEYSAPETVFGIEGLVRLVLSNLLSNASRYESSNVLIRVTTSDDNSLSLVVEDDGSGVPAAYQGELFSPFSRIDESRSRESGGIGLGLSLVDLIARQHRGDVSYFNAPLGGAGFRFCWPGLLRKE